ncbi:hypothetical protein TrVGV298_004686 [Trichoderma virens]|nr:hypothetical protein TrVGV298_004686 [Trichoderma virens]
MVGSRNEAKSSAARVTSQENLVPDHPDTAPDQQPAAAAGPAVSETIWLPEPVAESEGAKCLKSGKEPRKAEKTKEDTASQLNAVTEDIKEGRAASSLVAMHQVCTAHSRS